MADTLEFISNAEEFTKEQAERTTQIIKDLSLGNTYINFSDYSYDVKGVYLKWIFKDGEIFVLDEPTLSYLKIEKIPVQTRFAYDDYGKARKEYLKEENPQLYAELETANSLEMHLAHIDKICLDEEDELMDQMSKSEGITEELKVNNMLEWVSRRNNLRNRVREIVLNDLVYV